MEITSFITTLERSGLLVCAEPDSTTFSAAGDIDFLARTPTDRSAIIDVLQSVNAVVVSVGRYKIKACVCCEAVLYTLDIALDIQYMAILFPNLQLRPALQEAAFADTMLLDFVQAVLFLRGAPRHHERIASGYGRYAEYLTSIEYLRPTLFRTASVSEADLHALCNRRWSALLRLLQWQHLWFLPLARLRRLWRRPTRGKIVSIVGVDGAGKSTILAALTGPTLIRTQYMGDGFFILRPLYRFLYRFGQIGRKCSYIIQYGETWWRYLRCRRWRRQGYTVITDRWPGFNRHLLRDGKTPLAQRLFALIPLPDKLIMLTAPSETILARKQELTAEQIAVYETKLRQRLAGYPDSHEVCNETVDTTVTEILQLLYQQAR